MIFPLIYAAFQTLKEKSSSNTLDGFLLSFYSLDSSKKLLVTFEEPLPSSYTIKLHFESFTGRGSVDSNGVHLSPPKKAYVTFKDSQSMWYSRTSFYIIEGL